VGILQSIGRHLIDRAKAFLPEVGQTAVAKIAQGSTEVSNALFTGHAYSPYTADNAAHRAQFQNNREASQGMER
jgi:hypothetical protein